MFRSNTTGLCAGLRQRMAVSGLAALVACSAIACAGAPATVLEQLMESRRLAGDMLVQLTKAADASSLAVMADTDEASVAAAREADRARAAVRQDADALRPLLTALQYSTEARLLDDFETRFKAYAALDASILDLAVQNTNLKAQRLSFGPVAEAADAFRDALAAVKPASKVDAWQVEALTATAIASVREIQALQAPHIQEADEAVMMRLEGRMTAAEAGSRRALNALAHVADAASRSKLAAAKAALDQLSDLNTQIVDLSRRNSNVRSLALSLGQKRTLIAACDDNLDALQRALATRGFSGTR
jgi:hypothetical protein